MLLDIDDYETNGVAWPFDLSDQFSAKQLEPEYFKFQTLAKKTFGKKVSLKPNLLSTFFDALAFDSEVIKQVSRVIGPDIYIWSSAFFFKAPKDGRIVSFHQDNPYWQLTSDNVVTAWIALTESNSACGAMEIVPKSYKLGLIKKLDVENPVEAYRLGIKTTPQHDLLSYNNNLEKYLEKNEPVIIRLLPGQFSLHHVNTVHGSRANQSNNFRIGFAVRYISSETKHKMESSDMALHVCGKTSPYFEHETRPKRDFDSEAITCYQKAMESTGAFGNKKYG
jgi:non-haem Fe2+, alpha-ketoglutarate-dependent halogenase